MSSFVGRDIICAKIDLISAIRSYLHMAYKKDAWATPPTLKLFSNSTDLILVFLLSIDSGTGTTKLLAKFLKQTATQMTNDIILLGKATGKSEEFTRLSRLFGSIASEISTLMNEGISINNRIYAVYVFAVADFKLLYSVSGSYRQKERIHACTVLHFQRKCVILLLS